MYGKFSVGFRVISERAAIELQYKDASLDGVYVPMQTMPMRTLPGTTQMTTPLAKFTPITKTSQMPVISDTLPPMREILEPASNEQARSTYLERQMRQMDSIKLPSDMPSLEDGMVQRPESLQDRIQGFCPENKVKRKQEWESHRIALERMKESKEQQQHQQNQEERDAVYAQMLQNLKRTRAAVRTSINKASTISDEEHQLALMEDGFLAIQWKMDRIDQKLTDLYRNWQAEYRSAITSEDCEEVKGFYKPYLEEYESKYRVLYQMLQHTNRQTSQAGILSVQESTSEITPSLAALDNAQDLRMREWRRGEPGEDIPRQYSILCRHLTPTQPRHEDMRMDSTLNVTLEGSLSNLPAATGGDAGFRKEQQAQEVSETEIRGTQPSTTVLDHTEETPYTSVKAVPRRGSNEQRAGQVDIPRRILRTREASQEDALASARHFVASVNGQNQVVMLELPEKVPTTTTGETILASTPAAAPTVLTTSTITPTTEIGSPRTFLPNGSPSRPTMTATCRLQMCGQRVSEGWTNVPPQMALIPERVVYLNLPY